MVDSMEKIIQLPKLFVGGFQVIFHLSVEFWIFFQHSAGTDTTA